LTLIRKRRASGRKVATAPAHRAALRCSIAAAVLGTVLVPFRGLGLTPHQKAANRLANGL